MDDDTLAAILAEAGPLDDGILNINDLEDSEGQWVIRYANFDVIVDNVAELGKLVFSILIDGPSAETEADAYKAMLAQNSLWRETGGVRLALAGDNGAIEVSVDVPAALATPKVVATTAAGLGAFAGGWTALLTGQVEDDQANSEANENMIRV